VRIRVGNDLDACRDALRPDFALYIGGMGARSKNYYNDLAKRMGYEEAAVKIQNLYLDGKKKEAEAAVPDALIDEVSLVGPPDRIKDRLQVWKAAVKSGQIGTVLLNGVTVDSVRLAAEAVL
jgi:alkanesulfonate monooxygenase SsuD/methylene tetrahydromethanopterin reductase-like flavin-dependent oxidoreductase (luciferase family)